MLSLFLFQVSYNPRAEIERGYVEKLELLIKQCMISERKLKAEEVMPVLKNMRMDMRALVMALFDTYLDLDSHPFLHYHCRELNNQFGLALLKRNRVRKKQNVISRKTSKNGEEENGGREEGGTKNRRGSKGSSGASSEHSGKDAFLVGRRPSLVSVASSIASMLGGKKKEADNAMNSSDEERAREVTMKNVAQAQLARRASGGSVESLTGQPPPGGAQELLPQPGSSYGDEREFQYLPSCTLVIGPTAPFVQV